jgi:hypothetical protein
VVAVLVAWDSDDVQLLFIHPYIHTSVHELAGSGRNEVRIEVRSNIEFGHAARHLLPVIDVGFPMGH